MKNHETAQREPDMETKVPESVTIPAAVAQVTKAVAKWVKANERPPAD